jgi:hypothetical protein
MTRLLTGTAIAMFMIATPALAADNGTADTSTGAAAQSSSPPMSGSAKDNNLDTSKTNAAVNPPSGSKDTSSGAAEQSSAPPSSSAAKPMGGAQ